MMAQTLAYGAYCMNGTAMMMITENARSGSLRRQISGIVTKSRPKMSPLVATVLALLAASTTIDIVSVSARIKSTSCGCSLRPHVSVGVMAAL